MVKIILLILLLFTNICVAQNNTILVSRTQPNIDSLVPTTVFGGQSSTLWIRGGLYCINLLDQFIDYTDDNIIYVFLRIGIPPPCPPPPPGLLDTYGEVTTLNVMPIGTYTLRYSTINDQQAFPPDRADYDNLTALETQFEVLGTVNVDATSMLGLWVLVGLFLSAFMIYKK